MSVAAQPGVPLVEASDVQMHFNVGRLTPFGPARTLRALDGVSLTIDRGEIVGLIGESGSGKSTLGRCLLRIHAPTSGRIAFDGQDIATMNAGEVRKLRQRSQMIFQDPSSALNPRMTAGDSIAEHLRNQGFGSRAKIAERMLELFDLIGMSEGLKDSFPHELSGGQRQRVVIARAIATEPEFVVADEPVSALDVSVRAQILNLLRHLQQRLNLALLFISHDLSVIAHVSQRIAVMYLGRIVEFADRETLFRNPLHPYTHALLSAVPLPDPVREKQRKRLILVGEIPSPINMPSGCPMHNRCPRATEICSTIVPQLTAVAGHSVACHHPGAPMGIVPPHPTSAALG